jgi:SAM-dependent methyltransferase
VTHREDLARSWIANASAWSETIRGQQIESRRVATDAAIVAAVLDQHPQHVLDLGCGEGWLARALGVEVTGIDASPPLIEAARELGGGTFHVLSFEELIADPTRLGGELDVAVANFSLLEEDLTPLLQALPAQTLIVQTLHPAFTSGDAYRDGWRVETFANMPGEWREPMPYYFRTIGSWIALFADAHYPLMEVREPLHPERGQPLSMIFIARRGLAAAAEQRRPPR